VRLKIFCTDGIAKEDRYSAPSQPQKLENDLYTPFAGILQNDVQGEIKL
jgi:hypothetical protein